MAWIRSKNDHCFNVLRLNTAGRDIIRRAPQMSDQQLEQELDHYFHNKGWRSGERVEPKQVKQNTKDKEPSQKEVPNVRLTDTQRSKISDKLSQVFKKAHKTKELKEVIETIDNQSNEVKKLITETYNNVHVLPSKNSVYMPHQKAIYFDLNSIRENGENGYSKNEVLFHETGHAIDFNYKGEGRGETASENYISQKYNKTLEVMLAEEARTLDFGKIEKELYTKEGYYKIKEETQPRLKELTKEFRSLLRSSSPDIKAKRDKIQVEREVLSTKYFDTTHKLQRKYSSLSDMSQAFTGNKFEENGGHGISYFSAGPHGTVNKSANEFFAETFSSKVRNDESYELTKKYFPKTTGIFEEILKVKGVSK